MSFAVKSSVIVTSPSGTLIASPPSVPVTINSAALASHKKLSAATSLWNVTSNEVPEVPTVAVASTCNAPSISVTSKFVIPSESKFPVISTVDENVAVPT